MLFRSYSLLSIVPKDRQGAAIDDLSKALVDADPQAPGIQELKQWQGVIEYVRSFPDTNGNGLPDIPDTYQGQLGRIVEQPSLNPVNLLSRPAKPTLLVLAVLGIVALLIIAAVAVIRKRRKSRVKKS